VALEASVDVKQRRYILALHFQGLKIKMNKQTNKQTTQPHRVKFTVHHWRLHVQRYSARELVYVVSLLTRVAATRS
jgi:hypothetical protein